MRKAWTGTALALVICACGGDDDTAPAEATPPAAATAMIEAFNAHDAAKLAALYADGAVIDVPGMGAEVGHIEGRGNIEKSAQQFFAGFLNVEYWMTRVWAKNGVTALEFGWSGTPAPGGEKRAGAVGLSLVTYAADGRIQHESRYSDWGNVYAQLGQGPAPTRPVPARVTKATAFFSKDTATEGSNLALAGSFKASFASKEKSAFLAPLADGIAWTDYTRPEPLVGKPAVETLFDGFVREFPDGQKTITVAFAAGDFVVHESLTKGSVVLHSADVLRFEGGKIAEGWSFANSLELAGQRQSPAPEK